MKSYQAHQVIVDIEKRHRELTEGSLSSMYHQPVFLSPTWRVIFQEAVRGNHILFPKQSNRSGSNKAVEMNRGISLNRMSMQRTDEEKLVKIATLLFQCDDLARMRHIIHALTAGERDLLFRIYLGQIQSWRQRLLRNAH